MGKAKVRFCIDAGGQRAELASVRQLPRGDLMIAPRKNLYQEMEGGPNVRLLDERFSVHVSPNSPRGHTVTNTLDLAGGRRISRRVFVNYETGPFLWPLCARRMARPSDPHFAARPHTRDTVYDLGSFDPTVNNLIFFIIVSSPNIRTAMAGAWQSRIHDFEHFSVTLAWTFMPLPSMDAGDVMTIWNEVDQPTLSPREFVDQIEAMDRGLNDRLVARTLRSVYGPFTQEAIAAFRDRLSLRSAFPYEPAVDGGAGARAGH